MTKNLKALIFGFVGLTGALTAYAGGGSEGHGGRVWACTDPSTGKTTYELLDYKRARERWGSLKIDLGNGATDDEVLRFLLNRLAKVDPQRAQSYLKSYESFYDRAEMKPDYRLNDDMKDAPELGGKSNCKRILVINQKMKEQKYSIDQQKEKQFAVDEDTFKALDPKTRAGLILHEIVYEDAIALHHEFANDTIFLTAFISSSNISQLNWQQWNKYVFEAHFMPHYLGGLLQWVKLEWYDTGLPQRALTERAIDFNGYSVKSTIDYSISYGVDKDRYVSFYPNGNLKSGVNNFEKSLSGFEYIRGNLQYGGTLEFYEDGKLKSGTLKQSNGEVFDQDKQEFVKAHGKFTLNQDGTILFIEHTDVNHTVGGVSLFINTIDYSEKNRTASSGFIPENKNQHAYLVNTPYGKLKIRDGAFVFQNADQQVVAGVAAENKKIQLANGTSLKVRQNEPFLIPVRSDYGKDSKILLFAKTEGRAYRFQMNGKFDPRKAKDKNSVFQALKPEYLHITKNEGRYGFYKCSVVFAECEQLGGREFSRREIVSLKFMRASPWFEAITTPGFWWDAPWYVRSEYRATNRRLVRGKGPHHQIKFLDGDMFDFDLTKFDALLRAIPSQS